MKFIIPLLCLTLVGCAETPKDIKSHAPLASRTIGVNWQSFSNCAIEYLDDNMKFGAFGFAPDNSLRQNSQNKTAQIVSKHSGSVVSTIKIKSLGGSQTHVEAYATGYQMHIYTGSLKKYLTDAIAKCS